jgi:2-succinyl-5-enolpyruvyl-6-hydroxy-3-cyclohexene-1-carboxylate synthase
VSGATYLTRRLTPKNVWRVSPDGEIIDTFKKLTFIFEMDEKYFFSNYIVNGAIQHKEYFDACMKEYNSVYSKMPSLQFSNIWIAQQIHSSIPSGSIIHFGIFHSLRSWNFFYLPSEVESYCNVGGFGIDGAMSTVLGSALYAPNKLHFLIVGDLAFFYDFNSLGNRHFPKNLRILLVNNGRGIEFRKKDHPASVLGEEADMFIAAAGHYGNQSPNLVKHVAEDLGFLYFSASDKEEFLLLKEQFLGSSNDKPIIFEVFIKPEDDINSSNLIRNIESDIWPSLKRNVKGIGKDFKRKFVK